MATLTRPGWSIPDWLSPARLIRTTKPQWELVTVPAGQRTQILKSSATRVGLIIIANPNDADPVQVTPCPLNTSFGFRVVSGTNPFFASLSDWFSAVNDAWFALSAGGTVLQVCDIARLQ